MKRFLFLSMLVFIAIMVWVSVHEKEDDVPLPQKLERALRLTRMMEYQDDDYEYIIRYPAFFEQTDDSLMDKGCCRFSFWQDSTEIVQTAFVEQNPDSLNRTLTASLWIRQWQSMLPISMLPNSRKAMIPLSFQAIFIRMTDGLRAAVIMPSSCSTANSGLCRRSPIPKTASTPFSELSKRLMPGKYGRVKTVYSSPSFYFG